MASALTPDLSLSTIPPEGTPNVTPSVSRQSSRLTENGEESASRRSSKVMFTSTPKTSSDQLRRDSSVLSNRDQLRRDSSELSNRDQPRRDSSELSNRDQPRRDSSELSNRDQPRRDSSELSGRDQLHRDSSVLSNRDQLRRNSSVLSNRYPSTLCTDDLEPWDSLPKGYLTSSSSGLLSPQKSQEKGDVLTTESTPASSRVFADSPERSRDSFAREFPSMPSLQPQSSQQSRDDVGLGKVSSGPSELTSQAKSSDMDTSLPNDFSPASTTKLFSEPSRESAASSQVKVHEPSVGTSKVLSPRRSYQSSAEALAASRSASGTSTRKSSSFLGGVRHMATMTRGSRPSGAESSSGSAADDSEILRRLTKMNERMCNENDLLRDQLKLFKRNAELKQISLISLVIAWHQGLLSADECRSLSELSQLSSEDGSGGGSVSGLGLDRCLNELASLRPPRDAAPHRRAWEASGTDWQESSTRSPSDATTRRRAREASSPDWQESSTRSPNDAVRRHRAREASDADSAWQERSIRSPSDATTRRRAREASGPVWQQSSARSPSDAVQPRRPREASGPDPVWLESSVREIKRVLHHLERTLIDLDSTVRDHRYLWRDARRLGALPPLPASCAEEGASVPRLYIPRPHAEQSGTAVQFENKEETTKPDDSGLGGSFSDRGSFAGGEQKVDRRARRSSEAHDVREARLLGEVCHQLEQRVLVSVFPRQKIDPASFSLRTIADLVRLEPDPDEKEFLTRKLGRVTATLRLYGFDPQRHPFFMTDIMLRFGKFGTDWDKYSFVQQKGYQDPELLRESVGRLVPDPFRHDMLVVLDCLLAMAREDGCSIFLW